KYGIKFVTPPAEGRTIVNSVIEEPVREFDTDKFTIIEMRSHKGEKYTCTIPRIIEQEQGRERENLVTEKREEEPTSIETESVSILKLLEPLQATENSETGQLENCLYRVG